MKRKINFYQIIFVICIFFLTEGASGQDANPCRTGGQTCYFGVEINGILCGYSVDTYCNSVLNGKNIRYENSDVTFKMSLLGAEVDGGFKITYAINPATGRAEKIEVITINGETVIRSATNVTDDTAFYINYTSGLSRAIPAGDVIFASQSRFPYLFEDFIKKGIQEKRYKVYDPLRGEVTERSYFRKSEEDITLGDSVFHTLILEETDLSTGLKTTMWLNKSDGYNVKIIVADRSIYFADKSVTSKITMADMDKALFVKVDKIVPDIFNLSWLKVRARINSYGEIITPETLNFPGQKFNGTVNGSYIEGIFEVEPVRYNGQNAPRFPPDFRNQPDLKKYLEPELVIESDDPQIISQAERITSGSKDSWEAAVRLSKWVAENIAGSIPGGISAINTFKTREAECGGHSRLLAAFCRAVGIPARLSIGCMYTNYYSGSFGQHAWTEVYMGDGGWIPVDATINEKDFIDAGHIRLGENAKFYPVSMEIIEYKTGLKNGEADIADTFSPLLGNFMNIEQYRMFKIIYRNGVPAIDIPGRVVLDLNTPDDQGKWFPKLTREISLTPGNISGGKAEKIIMHQYFRLRKMQPPDNELTDISDEFKKFTGNYQFLPAKLSLDVMFINGLLTTQEPQGRSKERISWSKDGDKWIDKTGTYELGFITNIEDEITGLTLSVKTEFVRGEPVLNAVEPVLRDYGIEAALKKYDEIKNSGNTEYLFSENMLHQLGHTLLKENRTEDAIKVFVKNVREYPDSFLTNDALAETYMKNGENKLAVKYFRAAVKLDPDYEYGRKMIEELR